MKCNKALVRQARALVGARVRHYKGREYYVVAVPRHTEDMRKVFVCYTEASRSSQAAQWVRPLRMFMGNVVRPDGRTVPRFQRVLGVPDRGPVVL